MSVPGGHSLGSGSRGLRWRSLLFVPAHLLKFVDKAHERGADGIVLDLEDSVPLSSKREARQSLRDSITKAGRDGASVLVRVNQGMRAVCADLDAATVPGLAAIVLPKVETAEWIIEIDREIETLERERGLVPGGIRLVAQIETPAALPRLAAIAAAHPRLIALGLGPEDFSAAVGGQPTPDLLLGPNLSVLFAARAAGLVPLGFVGSIGDFADLMEFRKTVRRSRALGFAGAFAIHPAQVSVLNEEYAPRSDELDWARRVIEAEREAEARNRGAFTVDGKMIDAPIIRRARALLAWSE
ncbi:MAG: CoA ester lyase [Mesorhizobium sp.]|uniref:HpcH/HpaI aldolase/citrate lyase family protein n=1 Tax=Mesorhizobium sp. TaxID=1871066 RepID=UPI000FEAA333|nr:CoA ester lyase [Mesorhizobium sp.]RWG01533.1 MAG: CoA ester lyase [Mesorhizobium sp.]RWG97648.1 MAG: CoA ester lyase [Mesorhizobium sp.]TIN48678.1 MAG: CoA ester lyase [Mesorhizobium sp.]TIR92585.1 MAG: CoA ester lyase [Mesorhizobium sp.]TIS04579.1 MAG: CoA ester lyase [Mesorhizobium sp.]